MDSNAPGGKPAAAPRAPRDPALTSMMRAFVSKAIASKLCLLGAAALTAWGLWSGCAQTGTKPWNIVFVLVDTLRADHLGIYGHAGIATRNIDRLGHEGILYTSVRSQAACTFPSINSLLTSRYPSNFRRHHGNIGIPDSIPSLPEILKTAGYQTAAVSASPIFRKTPSAYNPKGGFGSGFDVFDEDCRSRDASCVTSKAIEELERMQEPFLLYLHYYDPHGPYQPPESYRSLYTDGISAQDYAQHGSTRGIARMLYRGGRKVEVTDPDLHMLLGLYDGEIQYLDASLGTLFTRLRDQGLAERTIIVLAADHGEEFLEHGHIDHCHSVYDPVIKTPLILKVPSVGRRVVESPVQNLDILPTLLDYVGLGWEGRGFDGQSLRRLVGGEPAAEHPVVGAQNRLRYFFDGRYKFTYDIRSKKPMLFDLFVDPAENSSLDAGPSPTFDAMQKRTFEWLAKTEGDFSSVENVKLSEEAEETLRAVGYVE